MSDEKKYSASQVLAAGLLGFCLAAGLIYFSQNRGKILRSVNPLLKRSGIDLDKVRTSYEHLTPEKIYEKASEIARETALEVIKKYFPVD